MRRRAPELLVRGFELTLRLSIARRDKQNYYKSYYRLVALLVTLVAPAKFTGLVFGRLLDAIDCDGFQLPFRRFELETELLLKRREK